MTKYGWFLYSVFGLLIPLVGVMREPNWETVVGAFVWAVLCTLLVIDVSKEQS